MAVAAEWVASPEMREIAARLSEAESRLRTAELSREEALRAASAREAQETSRYQELYARYSRTADDLVRSRELLASESAEKSALSRQVMELTAGREEMQAVCAALKAEAETQEAEARRFRETLSKASTMTRYLRSPTRHQT